ncbi:MAG: YdeI/OmpD-associated family protein [Bacteroidota bacterium]
MDKIYAKDRNEWRAWLKKNHKKHTEIYLVYYKLSVRKASINYDHSVDEALCFGWIDGIRKSVDEESYMIRFTPRKPKSIWSLINKNKVERLITEGKMMPAGMELVEHAKKNGQWDIAYSLKADRPIPDDMSKALKKNKKALAFFDSLSNTNKHSFIAHVEMVKKPEARAERVHLVVWLLEQNIKPYIGQKRSVTIYQKGPSK